MNLKIKLLPEEGEEEVNGFQGYEAYKGYYIKSFCKVFIN